MLSFASVQGFPSRPTSHQNAGYEDLLVRIEQALGHPGPPSRPKGFPDSYEDLLAMIEQRQGTIQNLCSYRLNPILTQNKEDLDVQS